MTDDDFANLLGTPIHPKGCTYGGFSCGYWLIAPSCNLPHWERHVSLDSRCPCQIEYPDAGSTIIYFNRNDDE